MPEVCFRLAKGVMWTAPAAERQRLPEPTYPASPQRFISKAVPLGMFAENLGKKAAQTPMMCDMGASGYTVCIGSCHTGPVSGNKSERLCCAKLLAGWRMLFSRLCLHRKRTYGSFPSIIYM